MRIRGPVIRHCIVLLVAVAFCGIGAARAEMHTVATFGNWGEHSRLVLAEGEAQGTRLAAIILDRPSSSPTRLTCPDLDRDDDTSSRDLTGVPSRLVVVLDKQTWPKFAKIWIDERGWYTDPVEGTCVRIESMPYVSGSVIFVSVIDKEGHIGSVVLSEDDRTNYRNMKDAIRKISDYLNQPSQTQPAQ